MRTTQAVHVSWSHPERRQRKGRKILAVLDEALGDGFRAARCLDVGCGAGIITGMLDERFALVVGVDVDRELIRSATEISPRQHAEFLNASGLALPFGEETFDVVVCAQVYEHVSNAAALFSEVYRILKTNGICFFSGPNKLALMEAHYSLPLLHWLPKRLANAYLRALGRGRYYSEKSLSYWGLRRILKGFEITDYTTKMIMTPAIYYCEDEVRPSWLSRIPMPVLESLIFAFPNYNWVLRKQK